MELLYYPDPFLRKVMASVGRVDESVRKNIKEMLCIMREAKGIGLAANQVGWDARVTVINTTGESKNDLILIDPQITKKKGKVREEEGCLSFPELHLKITRFDEVEVEATDLDNRIYKIKAKEMLARVLQHEIDHLDGVLFIDKTSPAQKILLRKKLRALRSHRPD